MDARVRVAHPVAALERVRNGPREVAEADRELRPTEEPVFDVVRAEVGVGDGDDGRTEEPQASEAGKARRLLREPRVHGGVVDVRPERRPGVVAESREAVLTERGEGRLRRARGVAAPNRVEVRPGEVDRGPLRGDCHDSGTPGCDKSGAGTGERPAQPEGICVVPRNGGAMEADSVTAAAEWDVVPAGQGHEGLRTLAADGFSGGVTDGAAWAMLTNGRVVGVVDGSVESFADADLTAHEAPDPALPLLLVMRERSAAPRARYYTEETPLSELDATLRGGGFTGFVELSENVLSGDYYVVYYGGDRLPVAFIGGSRRLTTGDEAFERADDEVGIYAVHDADVSVVDVPGGDPGPEAGGVPAGDDVETTATDESAGADDEGAVPDSPDGAGHGDSTGQAAGGTDQPAVEIDGETAAGERAAPTVEGRDDGSETADGDTGDGEDARGAVGAADVGGDPPGTSPVDVGDDVPDVGGSVADGTAATPAEGATANRDDEDGRHDDLQEQLDRVRTERDDLQEQLDRVRTERDDLRERGSEAEHGAGDETALPAAMALSGTNLFVRYGSKADPTLEAALGEGVGREAVDENLSLEVHTSFEREHATVEGRPFDGFLRASVEYRFVEWLVRALPYELRDAAGKRPLGRLYEAIPSFDRAEIDGTVAVEGDSEVSFDVVLRDRKGAPLAVASVFDSREPATEEMLSDLVGRARPAAAANESLGTALFVTTSYYAPDALELAESETSGGGLFSRGAKESYVRLTRSHGFHLCLVEARGDDFHLGVPEL